MGEMRYGEYYEIEAAGSRLGVMTCLRCGACVILDAVDDAPAIHTKWHEETDAAARTRREVDIAMDTDSAGRAGDHGGSEG